MNYKFKTKKPKFGTFIFNSNNKSFPEVFLKKLNDYEIEYYDCLEMNKVPNFEFKAGVFNNDLIKVYKVPAEFLIGVFLVLSFGMKFVFFAFFLAFIFVYVKSGLNYDVVSTFISIISIVFSLWLIGFLGEKYIAPYLVLNTKPIYELDRKNNCINVRSNFRNKLIERVPFSQCCCIVEMGKYHAAVDVLYKAVMVAEGKRKNYKLDLSYVTGSYPNNFADAQQVWDFINNYMDKSLPLPDIPWLEIHRSKDPVTKAYDEEKGRNPRFWRDCTDEKYQLVLERIRKHQRKIYQLST